jgi:hypothetical protein
MITREQAAEIAAGRGKVTKVLSLEELTFAPPRIYGFPPDELKNYWIAYLDRGMPFTIQDSLVVLVSKKVGRIAYEGGAGDEG